MAWRVVITGPAQKDFRKLPQKERARVKAALLSLESDPFMGDVKRLKGSPSAWRRRVGNYRLLFDLDFDQHLVVVSAILRRTSTTYD